MVLLLDENESFSLTANVEAAGSQRLALSGYLVQHRTEGTYYAPLIPQLFYGADGHQLSSWRQDLQAGEQTILSRYGGEPSVPNHELWWRKVAEAEKTSQTLTPTPSKFEIPNLLPLVAFILATVGFGYVFYRVVK